MKKIYIPALACLLLATLALPAFSDSARTPVYEGGTTLTQSGHYYLTRDITVSSGSVIYIDGTDITLDLNGFTLAYPGVANSVIYIWEGSQDITIKNGSLIGTSAGVKYDSSIIPLRIRLENLTVRNANYGFLLTGLEFVEILNCHISNIAFTGIYAFNVNDGFRGRFIGNRIDEVGDNGMYIRGLYSGRVQKNEVNITGGNGIEITSLSAPNPSSSNLIEDNVINRATLSGIRIYSPGCILRRNISSNCLENGFYIWISPGCTVAENLARNNTLAGFVFNSSNSALVDNNQSNANGSFGLYFVGSTTAAYRNNMLRDNASAAVNGTATDAGGNIL